MEKNFFTIYVQGAENSSVKGDGVEQSPNKVVSKNDGSGSQNYNKIIGSIIVQSSLRLAKDATEQYLDVNGMTSTQKQWSNVSAVANPLIGIAMGFAMGGPAGGAAAILGTMVSTTFNEMNKNIEIKKQNQSIQYAYEVTGNASLKGSRYTND